MYITSLLLIYLVTTSIYLLTINFPSYTPTRGNPKSNFFFYEFEAFFKTPLLRSYSISFSDLFHITLCPKGHLHCYKWHHLRLNILLHINKHTCVCVCVCVCMCVCITTSLPIHLGHFGCFHILAIVTFVLQYISNKYVSGKIKNITPF